MTWTIGQLTGTAPGLFGVAAATANNHDEAIAQFKKATEMSATCADCFYNLGATYHQQAKVFGQAGDWRTAEQYYHLCLSRNVAAALPEGWDSRVSASPDEAAILELLEQSGRTL